MNLKKEMVIIDDRIVTDNISCCNLDIDSNTYRVKYKNNNKFYNFSKNRLKFITSSRLLNLKDYNFYFNNKLLENIREIYEFVDNNYSYYHVVFGNDSYKDYKCSELRRISKDSYNVIEYMKKISEIISLNTEDGKKLLCEQMKKVEVNDLDNALANYL